ncbi:MAG: amidohydrolase family protein [Eubacterium sp.]
MHKNTKRLYLPIQAKQKSEVEGCIERYGKTPTELFEELGLWNYGGGGYHSVWLSDNDMQIYKKRGLWAVINAGSNAKLASGIADVQKMSNLGLNLAVGTDGPSSNNALDMFREMYLISILQKLKHNDAAAMDANEILKAATVGSARCMGLDNCDCIAEGKLADLTVIDLNRPNMQPINNITKNLVYSGSKDDVKMTVINGKILYENGEFMNIDKEEIYFSAQEVTNRLKK